MEKRNNFVFEALHVIAWIIFVGLCIEAGAILVNFIYSLFNPLVVARLYQKLDLSKMYLQSKWAFFGMYSFVIIIAILKAFLFYVLIRLLTKLNLSKPFDYFVVKKISQISFITFEIGILSIIARQTAKNLSKYDYEIDNLNQFWTDSQAFILMSAIIYIIGQIFKRGVELQNENDLTI